MSLRIGSLFSGIGGLELGLTLGLRAQATAEVELRARVERLTNALEWYAEQVAGCRKIGSIGDPARHALDKDGGERARAALAPRSEAAAQAQVDL